MRAIKGVWIGQTFALATSSDAGGKKSRTRRSKEERKMMVESFIEKYRKSNNGNFPSLNLTHKEVGGSFYTVREIVREIIQENKVLAPPKGSLAEQDHSGFLEQPHLGFISVEHKKDSSTSDKLHIATILPYPYQVTGGELNSNSTFQFLAPELNDEQNCDILGMVDTRECVSEEASHLAPNHRHDAHIKEVLNFDGLMSPPRTDEFEIEKIVNKGEGLEEDIVYSNASVKKGALVHDQENEDENTLKSPSEQYPSKSEKIIDETKEAEQEGVTLSLDLEIISREEVGGKYVEPCSVASTFTNSDSMVEAFPLPPVSKTILGSDGESGKLLGTDETSENMGNEDYGNIKFANNNTDLGKTRSEEILADATLTSNVERKDEKVVLNHHEPSAGNSAFLGHEIDDVNGSASKNTLSNMVSKSGRQLNNQEWHDLKKMNRINLKTWEGTSKKSTRSESNPVLALVKAFISAFLKFWSE